MGLMINPIKQRLVNHTQRARHRFGALAVLHQTKTASCLKPLNLPNR
jgi:hypothetical protein